MDLYFFKSPENSKGKAISYTVREVEVPQGYVVTETVQDGNNIVLTNSHNQLPHLQDRIYLKTRESKKSGKPEKTSKSTSKKFLPETGTKIMIALEILGYSCSV